jgi:hypothetical protein
MLLASGVGMTPRLLLLLPSLALVSCGLFDGEDVDCTAVACIPCPPPLYLRLLVPEGQPPPQATLEGVRGECGSDGHGTTACTVFEYRAGTFEFDIQATGYQKAHVRETVREEKKGGGCCHCDVESRVVDVQLTPQ